MSFAEQIKAKGREEGLQRGKLIGQILSFQDLLNLPPTASAELEQMPLEQLQAILSRLMDQLRDRKSQAS